MCRAMGVGPPPALTSSPEVILPTAGRGVLDGAFRILHALPGTPDRGQVGRLALATGLPRPTVYRLLGQLRDVGAVIQEAGAYRLAPSMLELGLSAQPARCLGQVAIRPMRILREKTGATVAFIVPHMDGGAVLEVIRGRAPLPVDLYRGQIMPTESAAVEVLDGTRQVAHDDRRSLHDVTSSAVVVDLGRGSRAALFVMTPATDPASRYERLTLMTASRIADLSRASRSTI